MSGPQILYGVRDGKLIHIDDVDRGQACNCTCFVCKRPLVARKGEVLAHFFAHAADEVICNPTPESLLHQYAKEQVAKLTRLALPGFNVDARYQLPDGTITSLHWRYSPSYDAEVKRSEVESRQFEGVVPDVLIADTLGFTLAVEVFYRHAVDSEKLERLKRLPVSAVEVDLSDLPANVPAAVINSALRQLSRWKWLNNRYHPAFHSRLTNQLEHASRVVRPQPPKQQPITSNSTIPSRMISVASAISTRVQVEHLVATLRKLPDAERPALLRNLSSEVRLALHCYQIDVLPNRLPAHLMQSVTRQSAYAPVPAILWQTGVFAKFCMSGTGPITAQQAAFWVRTVFPGQATPTALHSSANHLNEYSEAAFNFLNHLAEQGLLERLPSKRPWECSFRPVATTRDEVRARLLEFPAAVRHRPG